MLSTTTINNTTNGNRKDFDPGQEDQSYQQDDDDDDTAQYDRRASIFFEQYFNKEITHKPQLPSPESEQQQQQQPCNQTRKKVFRMSYLRAEIKRSKSTKSSGVDPLSFRPRSSSLKHTLNNKNGQGKDLQLVNSIPINDRFDSTSSSDYMSSSSDEDEEDKDIINKPDETNGFASLSSPEKQTHSEDEQLPTNVNHASSISDKDEIFMDSLVSAYDRTDNDENTESKASPIASHENDDSPTLFPFMMKTHLSGVEEDSQQPSNQQHFLDAVSAVLDIFFSLEYKEFTPSTLLETEVAISVEEGHLQDGNRILPLLWIHKALPTSWLIKMTESTNNNNINWQLLCLIQSCRSPEDGQKLVRYLETNQECSIIIHFLACAYVRAEEYLKAIQLYIQEGFHFEAFWVALMFSEQHIKMVIEEWYQLSSRGSKLYAKCQAFLEYYPLIGGNQTQEKMPSSTTTTTVSSSPDIKFAIQPVSVVVKNKERITDKPVTALRADKKSNGAAQTRNNIISPMLGARLSRMPDYFNEKETNHDNHLQMSQQHNTPKLYIAPPSRKLRSTIFGLGVGLPSSPACMKRRFASRPSNY